MRLPHGRLSSRSVRERSRIIHQSFRDGMPKFDAAGGRRVLTYITGRRAIDLGDVRRFMLIDEMKNAGASSDESLGQLRVRRMPYDHKKRHTMQHDGRKLVGLVANATIMRDSDPVATADGLKPLFVGSVRLKMICMTLHRQTGIAQYLGKFLAEIAVCKKYRAHASGLKRRARRGPRPRSRRMSIHSLRQGRQCLRRHRYARRWHWS